MNASSTNNNTSAEDVKNPSPTQMTEDMPTADANIISAADTQDDMREDAKAFYNPSYKPHTSASPPKVAPYKSPVKTTKDIFAEDGRKVEEFDFGDPYSSKEDDKPCLVRTLARVIQCLIQLIINPCWYTTRNRLLALLHRGRPHV